jgi:hypothetical protein
MRIEVVEGAHHRRPLGPNKAGCGGAQPPIPTALYVVAA